MTKTKKLTFATLLAFIAVLCCAFVCFSSNRTVRAEEVSTGNVAKVGTTEYATMDEAIANWTNGTTLTLLADATLSDVVTIKSTEHHILDLGTFTLTAADGKNAFVIQACGTGSSERYAITINADATNPGGINAGSKCIVYYKYADGKITAEDRPIIKINGGVFNASTSSWGSAGIYTTGTAARKCATVNISGGTFNCSVVGSGKSKLMISGGTFHATVSSQGDSTCYRVISGGTFKSFGFFTTGSGKFGIGSSVNNYDVGVYVNKDKYLVVGGAVITSPDDRKASGVNLEASTTYNVWNGALQYSSANANGLFYESIETLVSQKASATFTPYTDTLDLAAMSFTGTVTLPEGQTFTVNHEDGATETWTVTEVSDDQIVVVNKELSSTSSTVYQSVPAAIVTFDHKYDDITQKVKVVKGQPMQAPPVPTRFGYTFNGWVTENGDPWVFADAVATTAEGEENVQTPDVVNSAVTLYASWTLNTYDVTYDYGVNGTNTVTVDHGTILEKVIPSFNGFIFLGWFTDADYTTAYDFTAPVHGPLTLYAELANYKEDMSFIAQELDQLDTATQNLNTAVAGSATKTELEQAVATLNQSIETLKLYCETADEDLKAVLESAIATAKQSAIDTANANLDTAVTTLNDAINQKASKTDLDNAVATLNSAIAANTTLIQNLQTADTQLRTDLESAIATAKQSAIDTATAAAQSALNAFKTTVENDYATKAEFNQKVSDLNTAIATSEALAKTFATAQDEALEDQLQAEIASVRQEMLNLMNANKQQIEQAFDEKVAQLESALAEEKEQNDAQGKKLNTLMIVLIVLGAVMVLGMISIAIALAKRPKGGNAPSGDDIPSAPTDGEDVATESEVEESAATDAEEPAEDAEEESLDADALAAAQTAGAFASFKRTKRTLEQKLSEADENTKANFQEVQTALLGAKKVKCRTSQRALSFNAGRTRLAVVTIGGKSVKCYLALDPNEYATTKFHHKDAGESKRYAKTPLLMRVRSARSLKNVKKLIDELLRKNNLL